LLQAFRARLTSLCSAGGCILRFVLIDRLLELTPGKQAVASVRFSRSLEIFADHFPGRPIVPGVLLTEAMGQTGGWLIAATLEFAQWPLLIMIDHAKFRRPVEPDEELRAIAEIRSTRNDVITVEAQMTSGSERVATAELVFQASTLAIAADARQQFRAWAQRTFASLGGGDLLPTVARRR
jgi:3-hydroxyacyl-[acyl-carrier-protein] dehydratase